MKQRADVLLVEQGLAPTRARAQALLLAGRVYWGERCIDKSGLQLPAEARLQVRGEDRYVSRGGLKLEAALAELKVAVSGLICLDIGASTGGFTDCLLQHGALKVYAVDVGHGQLAEKLRADARVVVRERTNARHLDPADFEERVDLAVIDASFIGIDKLVPAVARLLPPEGALLAMIKPQFEVGREQARRSRGVIRDPEIRRAAIASAQAAIIASGFEVLGACDSRVPGPKGNVEHFVWALKRSLTR
jgi:23S rRNA (cytidine1920-2'-O)/16S rRNA (cytidine1409-2'-O)-methyltransferase